jgi:hypothetical protein
VVRVVDVVRRLVGCTCSRHDAGVKPLYGQQSGVVFPRGRRVERITGGQLGTVATHGVSPATPTFSVAWDGGVWEVVDATDVRLTPR